MSLYIRKSHNVSVLLYHIACPAKYRKVVFSEEMGVKYSSFITSNSSCFSSDTPRLAAGQFILISEKFLFFSKKSGTF